MSRVNLLRGRVGRYLLDSYTRLRRVPAVDDPGTPATDESHDDWGNLIVTYPPPTPLPSATAVDMNVPCIWMDAGSILQIPDGSIVLDTPTLVLASDDPLDIGDEVSNVVDREGVVRLVGPARITDLTDHGPPGYTVLRTAKVASARTD